MLARCVGPLLLALAARVCQAQRVHVVPLYHRPYTPDEEAAMLALLQARRALPGTTCAI